MNTHDWDKLLRKSAKRSAKIVHPEPDCRTCKRYRLLGGPWCDIHGQCTNANRYQALPPVKLWRTNATSTSP